MKLILVLSALLISPIAANGAAPAPSTTATFPFLVTDNDYLFAEVTIGDRAALAMIDLGNTMPCQLSRKMVDELGLETTESNLAVMDAAGNVSPIRTGVLDSLRIGPVSLRDVPFYLDDGDFAMVGAMVGVEHDALNGWGLLKDRPFLLDLENRTLTLDPAADLRAPFEDLPPIAVESEPNLIARLAGLRVMVETGAPFSLLDLQVPADDLPDSAIAPYGIPSKIVALRKGPDGLVLNAERTDLSALGVDAALGVQDLLGQVLFYDPTGRELKIRRLADR